MVGLTLSAIAVGAAFSAGALAFTTLILPMLLLMGVGGLASFGLFAGLGAMFVLPKLVFSALSLVSSCRHASVYDACIYIFYDVCIHTFYEVL